MASLMSRTLAPGKQQVCAFGTTTWRTMDDPMTSTVGGAGSAAGPVGIGGLLGCLSPEGQEEVGRVRGSPRCT